MQKTAALSLMVLVLALCVVAQDVPDSFTLHVTHIKSDYVGDKPATQDCAKMPCTTLIVTVDAQSDRVSFVLECKQWILIATPVQTGKCWTLKAARDYTVRRDGRNILFFDDKSGQTDPLFQITEETERGTKKVSLTSQPNT
jgi:hypothetical protein